MQINKLEIESFGQLHKREIVLHSGVNVLYGENESGKSTTHAFIRAMFFGLERSRGKGAKKDMYSRYQPWDSPTVYKGAMEFTCDGKRFRLERDFYQETRRATLVCLEDGEHLSVEDGDLDMLLGGITPAIYDNTVSVGQLKSVTGEELAEELQNYIANYQGGADGDVNPVEAMDILKEQRRKLQQEKREYQQECKSRIQEMEGKVRLLLSEQEDCQEKIRREQETGGTYQSQPSPLGNKVERLWRGITFSWVAVTLLSLLLAVFFHGKNLTTVFLVMACAAGIQIPVSQLIKNWLVRKTQSSQTQEQGHSHEESMGRLTQLREDYQERQIRIENLRQEQNEAEEGVYQRTHTDEELEAVELAMTTLDRSVALMENSVGRRLRQRMGEILSEITKGRYTSVSMEKKLEIRIQTISRSIELYQLSRGALEQVYFALRMAAGEVLCREEPMPVILDEVFAMYDDARLEAALDWLQEHKEQVILFTCQKNQVPMGIE